MGSMREKLARGVMRLALRLWPHGHSIYHYPKHLPPHTAVIVYDAVRTGDDHG